VLYYITHGETEEQQIHDGTDFVAQHDVLAVAHIAGATQGKRIANRHEAP
jgi:hypothetical protein